MPQDANSIPLDDEDILDLTVVAEPGRQPDAAAPNPDSPPEPGAGGSDFGADLDALLDSLSADGTVNPPAPATPAAPMAAPIADQTPVAHKVDPNEEMAMPEMADIDSLLAELGAEIPAVPAAAPAPKPAPKPVAAPEPAPAAAKPAAAPLADFDSLLAQAQAAEAQKAAEEAAFVPVEPVAAPVQPAPEPEPVPEPVPAAMAEDPAAGAEEADGLDLNELDALLDDILATAPEMSMPAQPAAAPAAEPVAEPPATEPVAMEAAAMPEMPDPDVIPVPDQALIPSFELDPSLAARIRRLEEAVEVLEAENNNPVTETMIEAMVEAKIAALFGPKSKVMENIVGTTLSAVDDAFSGHGSAVMERIISTTLAALTGKSGDNEHAKAFRENLERMAAAAAAKVIREEIAALMSED